MNFAPLMHGLMLTMFPSTAAVKPPVVTQIGDGQVQAPTNGTTPIQFTGAASIINFSSVVAAAALGLASVLLL